MEFRQLQTLLAVAEEGSFSAAADALHTVQSNVSAHIARLERELGATLVDRSAGRLTEEGEAVAVRAERIVAELEAIRADVAALHSEVSGAVKVGIIGTTARWLVPRLLETMQARHPQVSITVVEATSTSLEPQLVGGRLDLAVVNLPVPSEDLVTTPLFDEDLLLFLPQEAPLAARGEVQLPDLSGLPLLLPPRGVAFREELEAAARAAGATLLAQAELDGVRLIASLVIGGFGAAVLPATAVPPWLTGGWAQVPVRGLPRRRVGVAQRKRGLPAAPARALLDVLHDVVPPTPDAPPGVHPPAAPGG